MVSDVSMFRAEMLDRGRLWLACYLPGTGVQGDRIAFEVSVGPAGDLQFDVTEHPAGRVDLEP